VIFDLFFDQDQSSAVIQGRADETVRCFMAGDFDPLFSIPEQDAKAGVELLLRDQEIDGDARFRRQGIHDCSVLEYERVQAIDEGCSLREFARQSRRLDELNGGFEIAQVDKRGAHIHAGEEIGRRIVAANGKEDPAGHRN